jgi:transcriptional regulator with XRE-family HTH domain
MNKLKNTNPDPIDIYVGLRVRLQRTLLGMSQAKLAANLGLTFQQVQKYERGANRIGSSKLYRISKILGVSVEFFFDGFEKSKPNEKYPEMDRQLNSRETLELVRAYYRLDKPVRNKVFAMMKAISNSIVDE